MGVRRIEFKQTVVGKGLDQVSVTRFALIFGPEIATTAPAIIVRCFASYKSVQFTWTTYKTFDIQHERGREKFTGMDSIGQPDELSFFLLMEALLETMANVLGQEKGKLRQVNMLSWEGMLQFPLI